MTRDTKTTTTKKGKRRSEAGPDAPKRALTAYMFYGQDNRDRVKQENPDASFAEIARALKHGWEALSDKEKAPYIERAARDKRRADDERDFYDSKSAGGDD